MAKYLKVFQTHSAYNTYITGNDKILPNISYCENENDIHYNPWVGIIAKFNVTSTSSETAIIRSDYTSYFNKIWIDGVEQQSVVASYTFSTTGEHIVRYELVDTTSISYRTFNGCSRMTSVTIPNSVTNIANDAFNGCSNLTSITIPNSVTTIGGDVFRGCSGLTSVTIPNSVTTIGYGAFYVCSGLTSITIPNSVASIGTSAFNGCSNLTSITIEKNTPPTLGNTVFDNNASGRKIYVPSASVSTYQAANNWSTYASDIEAIPSA